MKTFIIICKQNFAVETNKKLTRTDVSLASLSLQKFCSYFFECIQTFTISMQLENLFSVGVSYDFNEIMAEKRENH